MTRPKPLRLVPLDIPLDYGIVDTNDRMDPAKRHQFGLDDSVDLWLIYTHPGERPRVSIYDPRWSPFHGLRYITWVT